MIGLRSQYGSKRALVPCSRTHIAGEPIDHGPKQAAAWHPKLPAAGYESREDEKGKDQAGIKKR